MHQKLFILIALCSINPALAMQGHPTRNPDLFVAVPSVALAREETMERIDKALLSGSEDESSADAPQEQELWRDRLPPLSEDESLPALISEDESLPPLDEASWPGTPKAREDNAHSRSSTPHQPLDFDAADASWPRTPRPGTPPPFLVPAHAPMPSALAQALAASRSSTAESTPATRQSLIFSPAASESTRAAASAAATPAPTELPLPQVPARQTLPDTRHREPLTIVRAENPLFDGASKDPNLARRRDAIIWASLGI